MRGTEQFHRQLDIFPVEELQKLEVTLIGAGALGSFSALTLIKMGIETLRAYDDDSVEIHNLPMQFYRTGDLEKPKVVALKNLIYDFEGVEIEAKEKRYEAGDDISEIVVSAVDNMTSRQVIWDTLKLNPACRLYIDTRAAGQIAEVFAVNPCEMRAIERYEEFLFPEEEAYEAPCTERMTTYIAPCVGAFVAHTAAAFVSGKEPPFKNTIDMVNRLIYNENKYNAETS